MIQIAGCQLDNIPKREHRQEYLHQQFKQGKLLNFTA